MAILRQHTKTNSHRMSLDHPLELGKQLEVVQTDIIDVFQGRYEPWGHIGLPHLMGSVTMGQAALAAYETVPDGFSLHSVQSRFLSAALKKVPTQYRVERIATTSRSACRVVHVEQKGVTKVLNTFSFTVAATEDRTPQIFDHVPTPSEETLKAAVSPTDPELDDAHVGLYGIMSKKPKGWPANTAYPAISNTRLSVSNDEEVSRRVYRIKLCTLYPNASPKAQLVAALFFSDFYTLDTPLTVQDIDFGIRRLGDKAMKLPPTELKVLGTLSHTLHFCTTEGFDVHEGIIMEAVTKWAKGRRAAIGITIWDSKGQLLATGEQEVWSIRCARESKAVLTCCRVTLSSPKLQSRSEVRCKTDTIRRSGIYNQYLGIAIF